MPKKKVLKVTTVRKTEYTDGSSTEEIEVSEFQSTTVSYPSSIKTVDVSPLVGKLNPQLGNKALS